MVPDKVELMWDEGRKKWLVRIENGNEVIRRHCDHARNTDEQKLRESAHQTVLDEGYEFDPSRISVVL